MSDSSFAQEREAPSPAASDAVRYAVDLAKKNSEALSFIPAPRLEQYHATGRLLLATENDEPCGFLVYGAGWPVLKVYQACIQYDARRRRAGLDLVQRLTEIAARSHRDISLWCADDLASNDFWQAAGFTLIGKREGGQRRGRMHNGWFLSVSAPSLFPPMTAFSGDKAPAVRAQRAST